MRDGLAAAVSKWFMRHFAIPQNGECDSPSVACDSTGVECESTGVECDGQGCGMRWTRVWNAMDKGVESMSTGRESNSQGVECHGQGCWMMLYDELLRGRATEVSAARLDVIPNQSSPGAISALAPAREAGIRDASCHSQSRESNHILLVIPVTPFIVFHYRERTRSRNSAA